MFGAKVLVVATKGVSNTGSSEGMHIKSNTVGQLELHGSKRMRTWTKLSTTAYAGDSVIYTAEPVDFKPGDEIFLAGTEVPLGLTMEDFGIDVCTVVETIDNHQVILSQPLSFIHRAEIVTVPGGRVLDLRGEVGLLTRNLIVQGDENSAGELYGVHVMAALGGIFRLENIELRLCGQAGFLGRYCSHSHQGGNMEGSYVKANSIHHSFQRAVTTHDTSYWEVRDNVAFDVMAHTYFLGTETCHIICNTNTQPFLIHNCLFRGRYGDAQHSVR